VIYCSIMVVIVTVTVIVTKVKFSIIGFSSNSLHRGYMQGRLEEDDGLGCVHVRTARTARNS
jgi:hypothetical protein